MVATLFRACIDFLVPPRPTERLVRTLTAQELLQLGEPLPYHEPRVKALVWELKYYASRRALALASLPLSETVLALAAEELGAPLLIPVPMPAARERERGHNHAALLCRAVAARIPGATVYAPRCLRRVRNTPTQQGLPRAERLRSAAGSMEGRGVAGRACIVVDDVATTGATLAEAKRALTDAGARVVHTVALAQS